MTQEKQNRSFDGRLNAYRTAHTMFPGGGLFIARFKPSRSPRPAMENEPQREGERDVPDRVHHLRPRLVWTAATAACVLASFLLLA